MIEVRGVPKTMNVGTDIEEFGRKGRRREGIEVSDLDEEVEPTGLMGMS